MQQKKEQSQWLCCICNMFANLMKCCFKDTCAAAVQYTVITKTRVYNASAIRQVTQFYRSKASCLFCCMEYDCGIEVSIGTFNNNSEDASVTASSFPLESYYSTLSSLVGSSIACIEELAGGTSGNILNVVSDTLDRTHNGDIHGVLEELAELQSAIIAALPQTNDSFNKNPSITTKQTAKQVDSFLGVQIVHDDGFIQIPKKWLPMLPVSKKEFILYVHNQFFH